MQKLNTEININPQIIRLNTFLIEIREENYPDIILVRERSLSNSDFAVYMFIILTKGTQYEPMAIPKKVRKITVNVTAAVKTCCESETDPSKLEERA